MTLSNNDRKVIDHFIKKNYHKNGFLRSSFWNRRIKTLLFGYAGNYERRKIFQNLIKYKYFHKQKTTNNSYMYEFNKKYRTLENREEKLFTVTFD